MGGERSEVYVGYVNNLEARRHIRDASRSYDDTSGERLGRGGKAAEVASLLCHLLKQLPRKFHCLGFLLGGHFGFDDGQILLRVLIAIGSGDVPPDV